MIHHAVRAVHHHVKAVHNYLRGAQATHAAKATTVQAARAASSAQTVQVMRAIQAGQASRAALAPQVAASQQASQIARLQQTAHHQQQAAQTALAKSHRKTRRPSAKGGPQVAGMVIKKVKEKSRTPVAVSKKRTTATRAKAVELDGNVTLVQLRREATRLNITGRSKMAKAELVAAIAECRGN